MLYHTIKLIDLQTHATYRAYIQQNAPAAQLALTRLDHAYATGSLPLAPYVDNSSTIIFVLLHSAALKYLGRSHPALASAQQATLTPSPLSSDPARQALAHAKRDTPPC